MMPLVNSVCDDVAAPRMSKRDDGCFNYLRQVGYVLHLVCLSVNSVSVSTVGFVRMVC